MLVALRLPKEGPVANHQVNRNHPSDRIAGKIERPSLIFSQSAHHLKPLDGRVSRLHRLETITSVFHSSHKAASSAGKGRSIKTVSISLRDAMRTGALRVNFVWSLTRKVLRD